MTLQNTKTQASRKPLSDMPDVCCTLPVTDWRPFCDMALQAQAVEAVERGGVLYLPQLAFALTPQEKAYLRPDTVKGDVKSVKFSLTRNALWGMASENDTPVLKPMLERYAKAAHGLIVSLFPAYEPHLIVGNTSFRPVEAEGRVQSKRHDDRLLHVDAFPSRPMQGQRILRVFTNVGDKPRVWKVGEPFADVAAHFLPRIPKPLPGSAAILKMLSITKGKRMPYDHYMLQLHDRMKLDDEYQQNVRHAVIPFAPGASWIVYSDQVSHAALSGQYLMEQTFTLPALAQVRPETSPLKVLEEMKGIPLCN
jgi:hypothetical protein